MTASPRVPQEGVNFTRLAHLTSSLLKVIHNHVSRNLDHLHQRPKYWAQLLAQHRAIWTGIREQQPDAAAAAARAHIDFVRQSMLESEREAERKLSAQRRLG